MTLERAIIDRIKADATMAALVGTKVFVGVANPNTQLPYVLIQQISAVPLYHMLGDSNVHQTRYQFEFYSTVYGSVLTARDRLIQIFSGFRGDLRPTGVVAYPAVIVQRLHMADQRLDPQEPTDGSQNHVFRLGQDWEIDYNTSVPA